MARGAGDDEEEDFDFLRVFEEPCIELWKINFVYTYMCIYICIWEFVFSFDEGKCACLDSVCPDWPRLGSSWSPYGGPLERP